MLLQHEEQLRRLPHYQDVCTEAAMLLGPAGDVLDGGDPRH